MTKRLFALSLLLVMGLLAKAQQRQLSIDDFALWNTITGTGISHNGSYVAYEVNPNKGDGQLVVRNMAAATDRVFPLAHGAKFSSCSQYIAFRIKIPADSLRKLKLAKVKPDKMPKDSLAILTLSDNQLVKFPELVSFKLPDDDGSWLAFLSVPQKNEGDSATAKPPRPKGKKKKESNQLTIMNPLGGQSFSFQRVLDYEMAKKGNIAAFTTLLNDTTDWVALVVFDGANQRIDTVAKYEGTFKRLTLDERGNQLAYLVTTDTIAQKRFALFYTPVGKFNPQCVADTASTQIPSGWMPSDNGMVSFSEDGTKLFFGTAPIPPKKPKEDILDEEKPKLDLWSWTDSDIQPAQLKALNREKKRTYLALYRIKEKKVLQLADTLVPDIRIMGKRNGELVLGTDDSRYRRSRVWNASYLSDNYFIDLKTGKRTLLLEANERVQLSPEGKFAIWYNPADSAYYAASTKTGIIVPLTKRLNVAFYDEEDDTPGQPRPHGIMGWAPNDEVVFVYDRYDIWQLDPNGKQAPGRITNGRSQSISFRYQRLDPELEFIPTKSEIVLRAFNQKKIQDGFFSIRLDNPRTLKESVMGDYMVGFPTKAKHAPTVLWSTQTVSRFPDLMVSDLSMANPVTISQANPQQAEYVWPTAELVNWVSFAGDTLRGILYKPTNFDSSQRYPMISYFYERSSDGLHRHMAPRPSHSTINISFYVSNGYLVFVPDIVYRTGYPGQSAYDAIVSGVHHLTSTRSYIDAKRLGLQGQSWGGYQIAYLVTQTHMFAAAMAGAPVSNMTSAYGGIRWGSGMSRMFQYEETQSRIGGTLWDKPQHYIENSPLFYAPRVNTPLLIMSNDNDGAVPWYQGIEMFMALYRLNKPVWLINYNGMEHNLETRFWANRVDLSTRMFQFFNHFLKQEPAPQWITHGIPAIDKGEKLGY